MNTWGYLILIAALFALAAYMLYARFSSRSRGKLLHHSPGDVSLESFHRDEPLSVELDGDDLSHNLAELEDTPMPEDRKSISSISLDPIQAEAKQNSGEGDEEISDERQKEDAYLDELQEAAAGLAVLMRSSPVQDRSGPVVFAPEDEEIVELEAGEELNIAETVKEETILIPAIDSEDLSADDKIEGGQGSDPVGDEAAGIAGEEGELLVESAITEMEGEDSSTVVSADSEELETPRASLFEILGEEVAGKFSLIDDDLDALEDLVSGVEMRLSDWNDDEAGALEPVGPEVISVEEAA